MANDNSPVLGGSVQYVDTAPSGACSLNAPIQVVKGTGVIYTCDNGTWASQAGGGGTGTVTTVSVTTANGVSGSVATPTTTPAISLTLGAITPSGVNVSGLTASQLVQTDGSKNLASTTALPSGTTATTQSASDNSTKVATTAYVDSKASGNYINIGSNVTFAFTGGTGSFANGVATVATACSAVVITGIPATYLHLQIRLMGTATSGLAIMNVTLNADTNTNYMSQVNYGNSSASSASFGGTAANAAMGALQATAVGNLEILIPFYASGLKKTLQAVGGRTDSFTSATNSVVTNTLGAWNSTAAINAVTITCSASTFVAGAVFSIHGIN